MLHNRSYFLANINIGYTNNSKISKVSCIKINNSILVVSENIFLNHRTSFTHIFDLALS